MFLKRWTEKNHSLNRLINQSQRWLRIEGQLQKLLPRHIAPFCHVVCINAQRCLVLSADNNLIANRLRMALPGLVQELQSIDSDIQSIHVRIKPKITPAVKQKKVHISDEALDSFRQTAMQVQQHPRLAAALQQFAKKRQNNT